MFLILGFAGCTENDKTAGENAGSENAAVESQGKILFRSASNIYTINPDGSNEKFLTTGLSPQFSPDGSRIAYFGGNYSSDLCVMNKDGTNQVTLAENIDYYVWLPDSNSILYKDYNYEKEEYIFYQVNVNGENIQEAFNGSIEYVSFSPDGHEIAYIKEDVLYVMNKDGTNERKLVDDELDLEHYGSIKMNLWSPDGSKIAYIDGTRLYVVNVDGTNNINIFSGYRPRWSPDGSKIAIWSPRDGGLFVMNADGTDKKLLDTETSHYDGPSWSPDGNYLVYSVGSLRVVNIESGESKEIARGLNPDWV